MYLYLVYKGCCFINENLTIALKYAGIMLALLMLVFVIACVTPKLAKLIDKLINSLKSDKNSKFISFSDENDDIYKVRGVFDAQHHSPDENSKKFNGDEKNG